MAVYGRVRAFVKDIGRRAVIRDVINKKDILIISLLLILALAAYFFLVLREQPASGVYGQISIDGHVVKNFGLSSDTVFSLTENPRVVFQVKDGAVAFIESNCPDKICVHSGFIRSGGQSAVCLPNKVSLSIVGDGVDTVASR